MNDGEKRMVLIREKDCDLFSSGVSVESYLMLFDGDKEVEEWKKKKRDDEVVDGVFVIKGSKEELKKLDELLGILCDV